MRYFFGITHLKKIKIKIKIKIKLNRFLIFLLFNIPVFLFSQKKPAKKPVRKAAVTQKLNYHDEFKKISDEIMVNGTAYNNLGELTKGIGPRFSATSGYMKAAEWAERKLKEIGVEMIWRQQAKVPVWIRGRESLQIKAGNGDWKNIMMLSFGNSEGTGGKDLTGEIVLINSVPELNATSIGQLKDKIVFVNLHRLLAKHPKQIAIVLMKQTCQIFLFLLK